MSVERLIATHHDLSSSSRPSPTWNKVRNQIQSNLPGWITQKLSMHTHTPPKRIPCRRICMCIHIYYSFCTILYPNQTIRRVRFQKTWLRWITYVYLCRRIYPLKNICTILYKMLQIFFANCLSRDERKSWVEMYLPSCEFIV